jgi:hypothetical protein
MGGISGTGLAVVAAAACLACGCASTKTTEWTGHQIGEVIKEFGSPTRTVPADAGRTIYVWVREHSIPQSTWGGAPGQPSVPNKSQTQVTTWTFTVSPDGTVVSWSKDEGAMY